MLKSSYDLMQADNMVGWKAGDNNESLCDTKGCIPLEVQIKRYLIAGHKLEELRAQNTFEDYDEAYKDIPVITQDMDITEILEMEQIAQQRLKELAFARQESEQLEAEQTIETTDKEEKIEPSE